MKQLVIILAQAVLFLLSRVERGYRYEDAQALSRSIDRCLSEIEFEEDSK